jgi:hypothetical protein
VDARDVDADHEATIRSLGVESVALQLTPEVTIMQAPSVAPDLVAGQDARTTDETHAFFRIGRSSNPCVPRCSVPALVPVLLPISVITGASAIVGSVAAILILARCGRFTLRVGYWLDGHVLTLCHRRGEPTHERSTRSRDGPGGSIGINWSSR